MTLEKNKYLIFILTIVGGIIGSLLVKVTCKSMNSWSFKSNFIEAANEINQNTPYEVDDITRLDSVEVITEGYYSFIYNYTILGSKSIEEKYKLILDNEEELLRDAYSSDSMKLFRENNVILVYNYFDLDSKPIHKLEINFKENPELPRPPHPK